MWRDLKTAKTLIGRLAFIAASCAAIVVASRGMAFLFRLQAADEAVDSIGL
jgi:hypothetical protein